MKSNTSTFTHLVLVLGASLVSTSMTTEEPHKNQRSREVLSKKNSCRQEDIKRVLNNIIEHKDTPNQVKPLIKKLASMHIFIDFEPKFIKAFSSIKQATNTSSFASEWLFTRLCVKYGFWELAYLTCCKVLDKSLSYGEYYDINAQYAFNILSHDNNELATKTLWLLAEQDLSFQQALFDASLKSYNWVIASRLCETDSHKLRIIDNLDTKKVYSLLKNQDNRFRELQDKFIRQIDGQDKMELLDQLNVFNEVNLFKRIFSTGGTNFIWSDVHPNVREQMTKDLFESLSYYQKLVNPNVDDCSWLTYGAKEDLKALSCTYRKKCIIGTGITIAIAILLYNRLSTTSST